MTKFQLNTPVVFIIFNRPDTTERVFAEIAKAKPPKLLVISDGPRLCREGEADKVAATRSIIDRVDWSCDVLTNYSEDNLGCKHRVSSGLDWVFEIVEEAIILEDDCLPHPSFFQFCEELLEHYRGDQRIAMISGDNFQFGYRCNEDSYYFSHYNHVWGWASWRDRWKNDYDVEMTNWPRIRDDGKVTAWFRSPEEAKHWAADFELAYQSKINSWAYPWFFSSLLHGRLSVMPSVNLISNIGFGHEATHTTGASVLSDMPIEEMRFPMRHPKEVCACQILDRRYYNKFFSVPLLQQVRIKLRQLARSLR
jgi:hypothetical protein